MLHYKSHGFYKTNYQLLVCYILLKCVLAKHIPASSYILEEQTRQKHQSVLSSCILGLTSQTPSLDPYKTSPKRLQRLNQRNIDGYYKDRIKSISMVDYDKGSLLPSYRIGGGCQHKTWAQVHTRNQQGKSTWSAIQYNVDKCHIRALQKPMVVHPPSIILLALNNPPRRWCALQHVSPTLPLLWWFIIDVSSCKLFLL